MRATVDRLVRGWSLILPMQKPLTESDFISVYEQLPEPVFLVRPDRSIAYTNAATSALLGYSPAELKNAPMLDLIVSDDRDATIRESRRVQAGQARSGFENRYTHRDGHAVHLMWSARRLQLEDMRLGLARDVTALKHAAERQRNAPMLQAMMADAALAPHEQRVLRLLLSPATEKQIAASLGLSVATTHSYVTAIYRKLGARSRAGVMSRCLDLFMGEDRDHAGSASGSGERGPC